MLGAGETGQSWETGWFTKAKMNIEVQAFGHRNLAKGGIHKMQLRVSPKSTGAWEKRMLAVLFTVLCNLWNPISVIIPASHHSLKFLSPMVGIIWAQTGENTICFSCFVLLKVY